MQMGANSSRVDAVFDPYGSFASQLVDVGDDTILGVITVDPL